MWRERAGPGHWPCPWVCCALVPRQCCVSHLGEPRASLLRLARHGLGSCSWSRRHTKLGDLPRKRGTSPTAFVACAGTVTSLWVPVSGCCRSCFSDLRCPPGSACLVRSEGWEGGCCPAGVSGSAHKDVSVSPLALRAPRSLLSPAWELSYIGSAE